MSLKVQSRTATREPKKCVREGRQERESSGHYLKTRHRGADCGSRTSGARRRYGEIVRRHGANGGLRATDDLYDLLIEENCKAGTIQML
ncbi:hypothetical protein IEQ34_014707 [Dendrobium chrysotoxum]|uniref:Uncharacterized protein n=1 Tax=Dendrobium chrysotoxum TaxID=161865 RepID=A0AAV7GMH6_DENCH|nr:hypothetical protein IEQ34_014707 [Dendrobium chrysotoxum]